MAYTVQIQMVYYNGRTWNFDTTTYSLLHLLVRMLQTTVTCLLKIHKAFRKLC